MIARALAALLLAASPAAGETPPDLSSDPLTRAAWVASAAVYRLDVTVSARALVEIDGTRIELPPAHRTTVRRGTAFGVSTGGILATAAHVAQPRRAAVGAALYRRLRGVSMDEADGWAERRLRTVVGYRVLARVAVPAGDPATRWPATLVIRPRTGATALDREGDAALLRLPEREATTAPTLALDVRPRIARDPVVALGFGSGDPFPVGDVPAELPERRPGRILGVATEQGSERRSLAVTSEIRAGDSGGPLIDARGRVLGLVTRRRSEEGRAVAPAGAVPAEAVLDLLSSVGLRNATGPADRDFRRGMEHLWAFDLRSARDHFGRARAAHPVHALAAFGLERVEVLGDATYRIDPGPRGAGMLWAITAVAGLAALLLAVRLAQAMREIALLERAGLFDEE